MVVDKKCAHEPCVCKAPQGQMYCSTACERAATSGAQSGQTPCPCGHADCNEQESGAAAK